MNNNTITTGEVRLSYVNVFQPQVRPGGKPEDAKYSVTVLIPKTDTATKAMVDTAINAAIDQGVTKCWNGQRPPAPSLCIHDGDGPRPSDGQPYGAECHGCWVFTASSKNAPGVMDANVQAIIDPREMYSGVWGRVNVTFFPYNSNGKKGVGCALNHVQKLHDGDPLVDRVTAEEAFGAASAAPAAGGAMPATPGYPVPGYTAPVAPGYPTAAPAGVPAPGYAPAAPGYYIDPLSGQPVAYGGQQ